MEPRQNRKRGGGGHPNGRGAASAPGFTLTELLIVIAILAVLAAFLYPVFQHVRENSHRATCQSNMRQLGIALVQYVADSDEVMPRSWYGPPISNGASDPAQGKYKWMDVAYPYVRSEQVFTCPDDAAAGAHPYIYYRNLPAPSAQNYGTYRSNFAYYGTKSYTPPFSDFNRPVPLSAVRVSSDTAWILEGDADQAIYDTAWRDVSETPVITGDAPRRLQNNVDPAHQRAVARHNGLTDVIWCDGHAKAVSLEHLAATHTMPNGDKVLYRFTIQGD